jgi:hydroxymethylbilane synthase
MRRLQGNQLYGMRALMKRTLRIGTRGSQLALWQARWVRTQIVQNHAGIDIELVTIKTTGDKITDVPLAKVGGKGLFVKEIEEALLSGKIDIAVHSMKDMPAELPPGLTIGAVPQRENPLDALISEHRCGVDDLPQNARVGTGSLRRSAQLLNCRPDITIEPLRGNIDTRLNKLTSQGLDAIILAAAGMIRLGLADRITSYLDPEIMLPAIGQGSLCIENRIDDQELMPILESLNDSTTQTAVTAERAFLHRLEGGCQVPIAGFAQVKGTLLSMIGLVAELDGSRIIRSTIQGPVGQAAALGLTLAETLLSKGADEIMERLQQDAC